MTEWVLDRPEVSRFLFHPQRELACDACGPGAVPVAFEVEPGLHIGGRLYPARRLSPAILFFHGNGEIAAHYDVIAPLYTERDITLVVADYRGYGTSGGQPTAGHLLADAVRVFEGLGRVLDDHNLDPGRRYVMGRSLGSAAAIEVAHRAGDPAAGGQISGGQISGLIVESGFVDTFALLARLGLRVEGATEEEDGFGNAAKMEEITLPTLVIHGRNDVLIPAEEGQALHRRSAAADKRLLLVPGAGHNDLLWLGRDAYMDAIEKFLA